LILKPGRSGPVSENLAPVFLLDLHNQQCDKYRYCIYSATYNNI
jgi:hypothetical protein